MKFKLTAFPRPARGEGRLGFTLAEVLAALAFMAIVIPVAVHGLQVASRAGQFGSRQATAARLAERVMNELLIRGQFQNSIQSGRIAEGKTQYEWSMQSQPWSEDDLSLITVAVRFGVQDQTHVLTLSTLHDPNTQTIPISP